MLPDNIGLLIGHTTPDQTKSIGKIFEGHGTLQDNLLELGYHWDIKVWFKEPVEIHRIQRWKRRTDEQGRQYMTRGDYYQKGTVHVFHGFYNNYGVLYYKFKRNGRHGYPFPNVDLIEKYEIVIGPSKDKFDSFEQFRNKFDLYFITEAEILKLWNSTSSQTGKKYCPRDFRNLSPAGKEALKSFLKVFKGINSTDITGYDEDQGKYHICKYHFATWRTGRDISISHTIGTGYVCYASQFHGYSNGQYGLIANKNQFLHLEYD